MAKRYTHVAYSLLSPARTATTGLLPGRAEQHLAGQIFSGLTRFDNNTQRPIGDLAHHWETSADGLRWDFYLRSTLHWHNGDAVKASHLHQRLLMLLQLPALDQLFISVKRIEVTHPQCLTFFYIAPITGLRTGWRAIAAIWRIRNSH